MIHNKIALSPVLRRVGLFGFVIALIVSIFTNETAILFIQNQTAVPGDTFQIGTVRLARSPKWLLLSTRSERGALERLYGIFPVFLQYGPTERYFSFRDITESVAQQFIISESTENTIRWAQSILSADSKTTLPSNCKIVEVQNDKMSVQCFRDNYALLYLPQFSIELTEPINAKSSTLPSRILLR